MKKFFFTAYFEHTKKILKMTSTEKIANARKRINELEMLIKYWDNLEANNINKIDCEVNNEKVAA